MGVRGSKVMKGIGRHKRLEGRKLGGRRKGYVPVRVGMEEESSRRFMVRTKALRDERFCELLSKSAEEYGFRNDGVLRILHEAHDFEDWILTISRHKRKGAHQHYPHDSKTISSSTSTFQFFNKLRRFKFSN